MQTSISSNNPIGRAGLVADDRALKHIASKIAWGRVRAGHSVFRYPTVGNPGADGSYLSDPGRVFQLPTPSAPADVDAILASGGASAASEAVWEGSELNGVVGDDEMFPPRLITLVLNSHTDWDATNATLRYYDRDNRLVSETLAIPNGGNATVTSTGYARRVVDLTIPAQSGTSGTFTIGVAAIDATITLADWEGVALYDATVVPAATTGDRAAEYEDMAIVPCMRKGAIWVTTEDACSAGADVYTRIASGSGGSVLGTFRSDGDTSTAVVITGARYQRASAAGALNIVELY